MTKIQWCDDVWNPLAGCTPVSPGCANCYAATMAKRLQSMGGQKYQGTVDKYGKWTGLINLDHAALTIPLKRRKPTRYFVNSMSDLFHEDVPDVFITKCLQVMASCPQHIFQILTKRPDRMAKYFAGRPRIVVDDGEELGFRDVSLPLPNVWLGTSVENQACADERIPHLLQCPAAVRFLSCEPLLGLIKFCSGCPGCPNDCGWSGPASINWVIAGGESGPRARACNVDWIRGIVEQCRAAAVPVFVKQLGRNVRDRNDSDFVNDVRVEGQLSRGWPNLDPANIEHDLDGTRDGYQGAPVRVHLRNPKGGDPSEWPEDLRVREMPEVRA